MKLLTAHGKNFQSYASVDFDYSNLGPALVAGPTKSGKSTLLDLPCWVLFGTTSKESAADDIRSWFSDEPTLGVAHVLLKDGRTVEVTRLRGKRSAQNDLYYKFNEQDVDVAPIRGKDAADTQKQVEALLGVSGQLYTNAAYIHQFSKQDTFFVAQAKYRREIVESIRDLREPVRFAEKCAEEKKKIKGLLILQEGELARVSGKSGALVAQVQSLHSQMERAAATRALAMEELQAQADSFEQNQNARLMTLVSQLEELDRMTEPTESFEPRLQSTGDQIRKAEKLVAEAHEIRAQLSSANTTLSSLTSQLSRFNQLKDVCPTCLGPSDNDHAKKHKKDLGDRIQEAGAQVIKLEKDYAVKSQVITQLAALKQSHIDITRKQAENQRLLDKFDSLKTQAVLIRDEKSSHLVKLEQLRAQKDPYESQITDTEKKIRALELEIEKRKADLDSLRVRLSAAEWLYDASFQAKAQMLIGAVRRLQDRTNEVLESYFDGALRVDMKIDDGDKVEVTIQNDGYDCPFKQLSGGERCMLKLAFNVAYMEAAQDCAGVHVDTIMLDEALNGLDADLKVKAYGLVEHLAERHASVMVIEHSEEFKQMFPRTFLITKEASQSAVSEVST